MKLLARCYGYAGFSKSAIFVASFDDGVSETNKVIPTTTKSSYNAELLAIKYSMLSVANPSEVSIKLLVTMKFIPTFFTKDEKGWVKKIKSDAEVVQWIREYSTKFAQFEISLNEDPASLAKLKGIAQLSGIK